MLTLLFPARASRRYGVLTCGVVLVLLAVGVPAGADDDEPVTVTGDNHRSVDIRVRHDRVRPGALKPGNPRAPGPADAPPEYDEPCIYPNARLDVRCDAPDPAPSPGVTVGVEAVALEARRRLTLPLPTVNLRPMVAAAGGGPGGITGAPVWLWTDARHWPPHAPLRAEAHAGPVGAWVRATPVRMVWLPGDGGTVVCAGAGTPLTDPATGLAGSPDCGHTYRRTSGRQPQGVYRVTVTVVWAVTWVGSDGSGGTLTPLRATTTVPYRVVQARGQLVAPP